MLLLRADAVVAQHKLASSDLYIYCTSLQTVGFSPQVLDRLSPAVLNLDIQFLQGFIIEHLQCSLCYRAPTVAACRQCLLRVCRRCLVANTGLCRVCWEGSDTGSPNTNRQGHLRECEGRFARVAKRHLKVARLATFNHQARRLWVGSL